MRSRRRIAIVLVAGAILLAAAAGLLGARLLRARGSERSFRERIEEIDEQIAHGYLTRAEYGLRAAADSAASEHNWLRLLKRALRIARSTLRYTDLEMLSRRASAGIPGSRALRRISLYARLRTGQDLPPDTPRGLTADPDLQYLLAEAAVRAGPEKRPPADLSPELAELLASRLRPEPGTLRALATRWQQPALLRDAGLLWMAAGETAQAAAAFRELPEGHEARELRLAVAYDSGSWEEALGLIESEPQTSIEEMLIRADLLLLLRRDLEALGLYQEAIARDPRFFWSPYLNLAGILAGRGETATSAELYRRAYELFPASEAAATAFLSSLVLRGEREAALQALEATLERFPDSLPLRWLMLELGRGAASPQRYLAGLRRLYAENPQNALLCRTLVSLLLGLGDPSGAWAVLEEYEGAEAQSWLSELKGLVRGLQGDFAGGADWLRRSLEAGEDGRVRYNLAVLLAAGGDSETAVRELMQASDELAGRPRLASQVRSRLAEELLRAGNRAAARRESAYALELDPANGRALLILRMLEAE